MPYHIALSKPMDVGKIAEESRHGHRPRHVIAQLSDQLSANVHSPPNGNSHTLDKVKSYLIGTPETWALAKYLSTKLSSKDVVYCPDEQIGIPLMIACANQYSKPNIVTMVHNISRPRAKIVLSLFKKDMALGTFVSVSSQQIDFLRSYAGISQDQSIFLHDQTDVTFFKPAVKIPKNDKPRIVSAGLEQRDYKLMIKALGDLDIDVQITGFSADTHSKAPYVPTAWPKNFHISRYDWPDFAALYASSDMIVIPLIQNKYAAGVTTLIEGMASGKPIIITATEGLKGYLDTAGAIITVKPGDADDLRNAVNRLLRSPTLREKMGEQALKAAHSRYRSERLVDQLSAIMKQLA